MEVVPTCRHTFVPKAAAKAIAKDGKARALRVLKEPNSNSNLLYSGPANP